MFQCIINATSALAQNLDRMAKGTGYATNVEELMGWIFPVLLIWIVGRKPINEFFILMRDVVGGCVMSLKLILAYGSLLNYTANRDRLKTGDLKEETLENYSDL